MAAIVYIKCEKTAYVFSSSALVPTRFLTGSDGIAWVKKNLWRYVYAGQADLILTCIREGCLQAHETPFTRFERQEQDPLHAFLKAEGGAVEIKHLCLASGQDVPTVHTAEPFADVIDAVDATVQRVKDGVGRVADAASRVLKDLVTPPE